MKNAGERGLRNFRLALRRNAFESYNTEIANIKKFIDNLLDYHSKDLMFGVSYYKFEPKFRNHAQVVTKDLHTVLFQEIHEIANPYYNLPEEQIAYKMVGISRKYFVSEIYYQNIFITTIYMPFDKVLRKSNKKAILWVKYLINSERYRITQTKVNAKKKKDKKNNEEEILISQEDKEFILQELIDAKIFDENDFE